MKRLFFLIMAIAMMTPFCAICHNHPKKKIAVYVTGDSPDGYDKVVSSAMITAITQSNDYVAIERNAEFIRKVDDEHDTHLARVRDNQIAAIGQEFGAKYVAVIDLSDILDEVFISARLIDVETAAIASSCENSSPVESMEQLRNLAKDIATRLIGINLGGNRSQGSVSNGQNRTFSVNGISFEMVAVPGGNYMMGSYNGDSDEQPVHQEYVRDFMIGKTEVTQELWRAVMGSNPSYFSGEKNPVERVSFNDCLTFIGRLNQLTGQNFRLPTETEWEYAARGGNRSNNYTYSGGNDLYLVGWFEGNAGGRTHEVATLQPNELGIYDMSGNVWEWTSDIYSNNYNQPRNTSYRVDRGGGYNGTASYCRVANRSSNSPGNSYNSLGLRLAL